MVETFIARKNSDQNAAKYAIVNRGLPNEAIQLDDGHVRHHERVNYHHEHGKWRC